jgi:IMP dehydrogenase
MAELLDDISRTFDEYLLIPGLTTKKHTPANVSLKVPLASYRKGEEPRASLNIPFVSAAMQAVSGPELAVALARKGGAAFIFCSQPIETQAQMVRETKEHKAGFVASDSNLPPTATLREAIALRKQTGHSTIPITENGKPGSKLLGLLTSKDFWEYKDDLSQPVSHFFTPVERLVMGQDGISLAEATDILWKNKKECLPIVDKHGNLHSLVFRKDYFDHKSNPDELVDDRKRLFVGAALNTHDYKDRAPALIAAGVDVMCFDSSDGHTEWQSDAVNYLRKQYGPAVVVGGGNVVTSEGFRYLVEKAQVDFVKVGIGGGSICITRGQKGIGRGQASAILAVAQARDQYFKETGVYVPICSDGGINNDMHLAMALALGADFLMMGKYFASTKESAAPTINHMGRLYKRYWAEGSNRARNWQRYADDDSGRLAFEEGVDGYVPYSGSLAEKLDLSLAKIRATMCNVGALTIKEFHENAVLTRVSEMTLVESGTSHIERLERLQRSDD